RTREPGDEVDGQFGGEAGEQDPGLAFPGVEAEAEPEAELGVVLEERVVPGRTAPVGAGGVRRGGEVGAVDGRAAGGVGDDEPVAEQLGEGADVGGLAAAG